jgi:hypothetical protein
MTALISIRLDRDLIHLAAVEAKAHGLKRHEWIETAIRKGLDGGDRLAAQQRPEEEALVSTQPSTPSQILATPIEENSEKSNETGCRWSKDGEHKWSSITRVGGDYVRCDLCRKPKPGSAPPLSVVAALAAEVAL